MNFLPWSKESKTFILRLKLPHFFFYSGSCKFPFSLCKFSSWSSLRFLIISRRCDQVSYWWQKAVNLCLLSPYYAYAVLGRSPPLPWLLYFQKAKCTTNMWHMFFQTGLFYIRRHRHCLGWSDDCVIGMQVTLCSEIPMPTWDWYMSSWPREMLHMKRELIEG